MTRNGIPQRFAAKNKPHGCTLVQTKLNAFARQMSPPEMKLNAQYGNFMLLCSHGGGGERNLKSASGFQSVAPNIGQWHLCDDKTLCWCQNGLRPLVCRFFHMLSPLFHIYSYHLSKRCGFNSKVAGKKRMYLFC